MRFFTDPYKFNTCSYIRYRSLPVGPQVLLFLFQIHIVFHTHLSHFPVCLTPTVYICFEILAIPNSIYLMFSANWLNASIKYWIRLINNPAEVNFIHNFLSLEKIEAFLAPGANYRFTSDCWVL